MTFTPYIHCEHCHRSVRSEHFDEHAAKYCVTRETPKPDDVQQEMARRDLAEAIRNRR